MILLKNKFFALFCFILLLVPAQAGWFGPTQDRKEYVHARDTYSQGNYEQAVQELSEYIYKTKNIKRREARAYRLLGLSYEHLNRPGKALEVYQEALEFHQKNIPLLLAAAALYQRTDLLDQSIALYNRVLDLEPTNEEALSGQAYNYLKMGFYSKARLYYEQLFQAQPQASALERARYAYVCFNQHDYEHALIQIVDAIQQDEYNAQYWLLSAQIYKQMGILTEALADLDIAIWLAPERMENQALKSTWLYQQKDFKASLAQARQILKQDPKNEVALFMVYMNLKDSHPRQARQALEKIKAQNQGSFAQRIANKILKP